MADWSGLGFDPAPGDVDAVLATADSTRQLSEALRRDAELLRSVDRGVHWVGAAAEAFRGNLEDLPRDLALTADSFGETAGALRDYALGLRDAQAAAHRLEAEADAVQDALRQAQQRSWSAAADDPGLGALHDEVSRLQGQLTRLRAQAEVVEGDVRSAGNRAAERVREAARHAPEEPGVLNRLGNALGGFVREHAAGIAAFSQVLKGIGAALGVASLFLFWVPGLGQALTAASLTLTLGATALDAALWASGAVDADTGLAYASGSDVLVGAASAALFFAGGTAAGGLARASGGAARARAAGVTARVDRLAVVRREFRQTLQFARPSTSGTWAGRVRGDFSTFRSSWGTSAAPARSWFAPHVNSGAAAGWTAVGYHVGAAQTVYDNAQLFGRPSGPQLRPAVPAR